MDTIALIVSGLINWRDCQTLDQVDRTGRNCPTSR